MLETWSVDIKVYLILLFADLVLGSRSVGFTSATFFSQSKDSLKAASLRHFEHCPRSTMPYRASKNCSELLDMTQTCPTKVLKIARNDPSWPEKIAAQNCSKLLIVAQNCSKLLEIKSHNGPKCLTMGQVSKGVMCLHIQVRKLSLLGIAVAGVYCCMGLRSVSIEPRSCLLLRSEPSIVSFSWQGSLVIRLVAIVSNNGLSKKKRIALIGNKRSCPQFLLLHYCLLVIPQ